MASLQLVPGDLSNSNRLLHPYSRGYHYFFDLKTFPRLENSFSYAIDNQNAFHSTYLQEDKVINGNITVGQIFNRIYFGLPPHTGYSPESRDKNICHSYLFQNEDRKYQLDLQLHGLKVILENFSELESAGKLEKFSNLRKDIDLICIIEDDNLGVEEKKKILQKKIKILEEKKESMKEAWVQEDKSFYSFSLNQILHDKIDDLKATLKYDYILGEIPFGESLRDKVGESEMIMEESVTKMFLFSQTNHTCLSPKMISKLAKKIQPRFFEKDSSEIFEISVPFIFFSFKNIGLLEVCEKILAERLKNKNESTFYMCKIFWSRVFGRNLTLRNDSKEVSKQEFDLSISIILNQLREWKQINPMGSRIGEEMESYHIDEVVNLNALNEDSKSFDLFSRDKEVEINAREFICLALFHNLYLILSEIESFVLQNPGIIPLIASEFFSKAHNGVIEIVGSERMGILEETLKRLCDIIAKSDFEIPFKLKWVYNAKLGAAYVIKIGMESEWETEKEDNEDEDENEETPTKRVK